MRRAVAPWALIGGTAFFAAVCGHRVMDLLGALHAVPSDYGDYEHVGVAPGAVAGLLLAALGMGLALSGRSGAFGLGSGAAGVAGRLLRIDWRGALAAVFAIQLTALLVMENVEHFTAFGTLSDGLDWLGGPPLAALAVHAVLACAFTLLLRRSLAGVLDTCADLLAIFTAALAGFTSAPERPAFSLPRERVRLAAGARSPLSDHRGFRAPPFPR